jgi:hypothetical protein
MLAINIVTKQIFETNIMALSTQTQDILKASLVVVVGAGLAFWWTQQAKNAQADKKKQTPK